MVWVVLRARKVGQEVKKYFREEMFLVLSRRHCKPGTHEYYDTASRIWGLFVFSQEEEHGCLCWILKRVYSSPKD